jgi:uncharacterized RDD family membrane protein YckC
MAKDLYASLNLPTQRVHVRDASFLRRLLAFLTDVLIIDLALFAPFKDAMAGSFELSSVLHGTLQLTTAMYAAGITIALLALAYFMLFEYLLGQTLGMMLLGIHAQNVTLWRAFVRNLYLLPVFPFPILWVLEPLHLLWRKTRYLEMITKTRTVEFIRY